MSKYELFIWRVVFSSAAMAVAMVVATLIVSAMWLAERVYG